MSRWLKTPTKRRKACIAPPCLLETLDTDTQDFKQIINDISGTGIILFTLPTSNILPAQTNAGYRRLAMDMLSLSLSLNIM